MLNKMLKNSLGIVLIFMSFFLIACTESNNSNVIENTEDNLITEHVEDNLITEHVEDDIEENIETTEGNTIKEIELYNVSRYLYGFSEGLSWVKVQENQQEITYLIDKSGNILYEDTKGRNWSKFKDGISYSHDMAIDKNGQLIIELSNENHEIVKSGDGNLFVYQRAVGYETAEAKLEVINKQGEWVLEPTSDSVLFSDDKLHLRYSSIIRYCGEGIFAVEDSPNYTAVHDVYTNESRVFDGILISDYVDGNAVIKVPNQGIYSIDKDGATTYLGETAEGLNNNRILLDYRVLCDYKGNVIKEFEAFSVGISDFINGYAFCSLKGADGNGYFTIIDEQGNFLFDPIMRDSYYSQFEEYGFIGDFSEGIFFVDNTSYNINGEKIKAFSVSGNNDEYIGVVKSYSDGVAIVENEDLSYYMNPTGEIICSVIYQTESQ